MQLTPSPSVLLTQLLSALCTLMQCERNYPSPVPLPQEYRPSSNDPSPSYQVKVVGSDQSVGESSIRRGRLVEEDEDDNALLENLGLGSPPLVHTALGSIEGYYMTVISGRKIAAFEGIPYALPPLGSNRFKAPIPHPGWQFGTLEAKDAGPPCVQVRVGDGGITGSEDCLRMNIYSPKLPQRNGKVSPKSKLPVLVFIHGGIFMFGDGSSYGPAYLLEQDVILVTFNYRLGILGFFSTGDEIASGNWGLKDQALLINFVYEHISAFGGDRDKIVVIGQSAGAVCAHLQLMSPLARDKISSAILMSGTAYNFWGLNTLNQAVRLSKVNARLALCPTVNRSSKQILECMEQVPADVLAANQYLAINGLTFPAPTIEPNIPGSFLSLTPDEAYINSNVSQVPIIFTITSKEANSFILELAVRGGLPLLHRLFDIDAPIILGLRGRIPASKEDSIVSKIRHFYSIDFFTPLGLFNYNRRDKFLTEVGNARFFTTAFHKAVQMHSQISPTYAGEFSYTHPTYSKPAQLGLDPKEYGVVHTGDLAYLFNRTSHPPITRGDPAFAVIKLLRNIYLNFGKSGIPFYTGEDGNEYKFWDAVKDPENIRMLQIDVEVKMKEEDVYLRTTQFWESLGIGDTRPYVKLR